MERKRQLAKKQFSVNAFKDAIISVKKPKNEHYYELDWSEIHDRVCLIFRELNHPYAQRIA